MAGFDFIAPFYRRVSRMVFGDLLLRAQSHYLFLIPDHSSVLIIGGGNGEILEALAQTGKKLKVTYVEESTKMIRLAKERNVSGFLSIEFLQEDVFKMENNEKFGVIFTAFFLDCFPSETLSKEMPGIRRKLRPQGLWLFTDFMETSSGFQQVLTRLMYAFFRLSAGLPAKRLPEYDRHFNEIGMKLVENTSWRKGYVESRVYRVE